MRGFKRLLSVFTFGQTQRQACHVAILFIWKVVARAACPDIRCFAQVRFSPNIYNEGVECKVSTTHRAKTAIFMGYTPG